MMFPDTQCPNCRSTEVSMQTTLSAGPHNVTTYTCSNCGHRWTDSGTVLKQGLSQEELDERRITVDGTLSISASEEPDMYRNSLTDAIAVTYPELRSTFTVPCILCDEPIELPMGATSSSTITHAPVCNRCKSIWREILLERDRGEQN